ncbi:hypothetical protein L0657_09335 [Dyadobacter sp. CY345]|uniref:hypothetical protein n=1 Tax=Dyadobacter sp. CY345 TaxID=2909335 RepID=UPI001F360D7F|nr:hypothetical protein [Dyadobacter sp. CY345]MCF2444158.1 hypothetical protein [Dyadobacter sp. CY345]
MKITRLPDINNIPTSKSPANGDGNIALEQKVSELIAVIDKTSVDSMSSKRYQQQIADAFQRSLFTPKQLEPFATLDQDNNLSREELLEGLEKLLSETKIDSEISKNYIKKNAVQKGVMFILALLLIVVGFAMIIMPAPPSFELFTVFYFNANDGVTIMDLVSLLIIFGGVLLFVLNFNKK